MPHPPFQFIGGSLAIDFVNTVGDRLSASRDYFRTPADVRAWAIEARLIEGRRRTAIRLTPADLRRVIAAREEIYALLRAVSGQRPLPRRSLSWLNETVRKMERYRRLAPSARGLTWIWKME